MSMQLAFLGRLSTSSQIDIKIAQPPSPTLDPDIATTTTPSSIPPLSLLDVYAQDKHGNNLAVRWGRHLLYHEKLAPPRCAHWNYLTRGITIYRFPPIIYI